MKPKAGSCSSPPWKVQNGSRYGVEVETMEVTDEEMEIRTRETHVSGRSSLRVWANRLLPASLTEKHRRCSTLRSEQCCLLTTRSTKKGVRADDARKMKLLFRAGFASFNNLLVVGGLVWDQSCAPARWTCELAGNTLSLTIA